MKYNAIVWLFVNTGFINATLYTKSKITTVLLQNWSIWSSGNRWYKQASVYGLIMQKFMVWAGKVQTYTALFSLLRLKNVASSLHHLFESMHCCLSCCFIIIWKLLQIKCKLWAQFFKVYLQSPHAHDQIPVIAN